MNRMHKPDPKLGPDQQDKRSVIPIEPEFVDTWVAETQADAQALLKLSAADLFNASPAVLAQP